MAQLQIFGNVFGISIGASKSFATSYWGTGNKLLDGSSVLACYCTQTVAPGEPKEGAEPNAPPGDPAAPNSGALVAPNAGVLAAPKAGVLAAPNAGVLLPKEEEAPKAGAAAAPNAGVEAAPNALLAPNAGCRHENVSLRDPPVVRIDSNHVAV